MFPTVKKWKHENRLHCIKMSPLLRDMNLMSSQRNITSKYNMAPGVVVRQLSYGGSRNI